MKVVQINATCGSGSTGKICESISRILTSKNIENFILYSEGKSDYPLAIKYISTLYLRLQSFISHFNGKNGFNCIIGTYNLIHHLKKIKPTIIQIHNIHGNNVNLKIFFRWIIKNNVKVYWTFHDCWAFTGYCTYFDLAKCEKWKKNCMECPKWSESSWLFDKSKKLYELKKKIYKDIDFTIITPSQWLAKVTKHSFLKEHKVKIINNGIDLNVFKPRKTNFRKINNIDKDFFILLGVSFDWSVRKGLDIFIELFNRLDTSKFKIVLVGTNDSIDNQLPKGIISIHRTQNQIELSEIYSSCDLFVNPTREENYPTVNMESIACGTPVITFNTGGSPEILDEETGLVINSNNIDDLEKEIKNIERNRPFNRENCQKKSKDFEQMEKINQYISAYLENEK